MLKKGLVIFFILLSSLVYADESIEEKHYVEAGSVYVASNGIFINIDGELFGITSLNADENGVYISEPLAGFCGKHGTYPGNAKVCPYCLAEKKRV